MKNTLATAVYVILAMSLIYVSLFFLSCKKREISNSATKASLENIGVFPADNPWNKDISHDAVDPYSSQIIANFSSSPVKTDFGSGEWDGAPIGISYVAVCGSQQKIVVNFTDYGDESDAG